MQQTNGTQQRNGGSKYEPTPYEAAVLGFRNYWYPVFTSGEVTERARAITLLGDDLFFVRRQGKVYALNNECAHRGTRFTHPLGIYYFKGTSTITCGYHGWTYDVTNGMCVAVPTEGPTSQVPGKVRLRTYPVEERGGIVWVWVGEQKPVSVEEDIPKALLLDNAVIKVRNVIFNGNWRWHAENVNGGHDFIVHNLAGRNWFKPLKVFPDPETNIPQEVEDWDGKGVASTQGRGSKSPSYSVWDIPGLGKWPQRPLWHRLLVNWWIRRAPRYGGAGVSGGMLSLPGYFRVPGHPNNGNLYYEWYVPVDEEHYIYFQVTSWFPTNIFGRLGHWLKYYLHGKPIGVVRFNNQDAAMVAETTAHVKRRGPGAERYFSKLTQNDRFHELWRQYCNENARGVGYAYTRARNAKPRPATRQGLVRQVSVRQQLRPTANPLPDDIERGEPRPASAHSGEQLRGG